MIKRLGILYICSFFLPAISMAQMFAPKNYPQGYFQWPVGAKVALAANFGELRSNHYHMGLDCKTDQRVNLPVYAAADGYVAKVKIEPFGFGRAIYINHPNGLTTLYAHLNDFYPALETYVTEQQYKQKQWKVMLDIPANLFIVKKGDLIAGSGNTGGSQGPHLHFEIRDTKSDKVLNPLLFGFPIKDQVAPDILRLAVYDRRYSTYEQTPRIYPLKKVNGIYRPVAGNIKIQSDKVSFAITAYDRYSGSTNQNGIFRAELFDNDRAITGFEMDNISYDETRYLNAHIDYRTKANGGPYLQHLSVLPGYNDGIYRSMPGENGVIRLENDTPHEITITATDANDNYSTLKFSIKKDGIPPERPAVVSGQLFKPGMINVFENSSLRFYLPEKCLYDSFHFSYSASVQKEGRPVYQVHNNQVPLQDYFQLKIRDDYNSADTGQMIMLRFWNNKKDYKKATFENNWYKAAFREFGNFLLIADSIAPTITALGGFRDGMNAARLHRIAFLVADNTEEIKQFTALLDGNWLRFSNDKGKVFSYTFDKFCPPGEHELKIIVEDLAGNKTEKTYHFSK